MKLCAVVVTYYPDRDELLCNIRAYVDHVDALIVWENTPEPHRMEYRVAFESDKVIFMGDGRNHCIARPLNTATEWAERNGYTHLLTMDQDSLFEPGAFEKYVEIVEEQNGGTGIFGVNPNGAFPETDVPLEVADTITSGSIYDISMLRAIGGFREDFAIDGVDYDISYRAAESGFATVVFGSVHLEQQYGDARRTRWGFSVDNYSAFRLYHIARNHTILWREHPRRFRHKRQLVRNFVLLRMVKILLAEGDKRKKTAAIFRGLYDGLLGRPNKFNKA